MGSKGQASLDALVVPAGLEINQDTLKTAMQFATLAAGDALNGLRSTDTGELEQAEALLPELRPKISAFSYDIVSPVQSGDVAAARAMATPMPLSFSSGSAPSLRARSPRPAASTLITSAPRCAR